MRPGGRGDPGSCDEREARATTALSTVVIASVIVLARTVVAVGVLVLAPVLGQFFVGFVFFCVAGTRGLAGCAGCRERGRPFGTDGAEKQRDHQEPRERHAERSGDV